MAGIPDTPYSVSCSSPDSLAISRPPAHRATVHNTRIPLSPRSAGWVQRSAVRQGYSGVQLWPNQLWPAHNPPAVQALFGRSFSAGSQNECILRQRLP